MFIPCQGLLVNEQQHHLLPLEIMEVVDRKNLDIEWAKNLFEKSNANFKIFNKEGPYQCTRSKGHPVLKHQLMYFKTNGEPSSTCLAHKIELNAPDNVTKFNKKVFTNYRASKSFIHPIHTLEREPNTIPIGADWRVVVLGHGSFLLNPSIHPSRCSRVSHHGRNMIQ